MGSWFEKLFVCGCDGALIKVVNSIRYEGCDLRVYVNKMRAIRSTRTSICVLDYVIIWV